MAGLARAEFRAANEVYATRHDFCRIFTDEMNSLYLLAFLLTANHEAAERCFVAGLTDSVDGNPVFKEWARSWARRSVFRNAIREVFRAGRPESRQAADASGLDSAPAVAIAAVTHLPPIERFVFVMSVLEGYSDAECAVLLNCTREAVARARMRALQVWKDQSRMWDNLLPKTA